MILFFVLNTITTHILVKNSQPRLYRTGQETTSQPGEGLKEDNTLSKLWVFEKKIG
jgi:hypothetical protein